jgi:uncharacterized protein
MVNWKNKVAIVTGASSGIGAATAWRLASEGLVVVLVARRKNKLINLAKRIEEVGGRAVILTADLAKERDRTRLFDEVGKRFGGVDVLVNNAGLGWYGYGSDMSLRTAMEMLQVNVEAVVQLSIEFLRGMKKKNSGHIINIGSISGSIPSQGVALYGATKSFLDNFTTAMYRELSKTGVKISVVRAGPVRTEFSEAALARENGGHVPTEKIGVSADHIAGKVWKLLLHPKRVIYVPGWLRIVPWAELLFGWIIDKIGPALLKRQGV